MFFFMSVVLAYHTSFAPLFSFNWTCLFLSCWLDLYLHIYIFTAYLHIYRYTHTSVAPTTDVCVIGFVFIFTSTVLKCGFSMFLAIISELFQRLLVVIRIVAVVGLQVTRPIRCYFHFSRPAFRIYYCGQLHFFINHCEAGGGGYLQGPLQNFTAAKPYIFTIRFICILV
jgi:hypothetical protein